MLHVSDYDTLTKRNQILIYLFFLLERNTPRMAEYQTAVLEEEKKNPLEMMLLGKKKKKKREVKGKRVTEIADRYHPFGKRVKERPRMKIFSKSQSLL